MKVQMQVVSIILIIGIIIVLTGATYFWGKPLIDKRVMITQLATLKEFVQRLDKKIVDMAKSCTSYCDETLSIPPSTYLTAYRYDAEHPDNNSIVLEFAINYLMMGNESVPINTNVLAEVAPYGETNSVITMRQVLAGQQYKIIFRIQYRELDTKSLPKKGYKIILEPEAMAGQGKVKISFGRTSVIPGAASNDGPLTATKIKIDTA